MTRMKWIYGACGVLAAAAVLGQASTASAIGCALLDRPWDDELGNLQSLECADGSASGSVQFLSDNGQVKTYVMVVEIIDDPAPAAEFATIRLQNGAGQTFPAIQDQAVDGFAAVQDQDVAVNFVMEFIELEAGDRSGN